jgi:hypothetical protein
MVYLLGAIVVITVIWLVVSLAILSRKLTSFDLFDRERYYRKIL